MATYHRVIGIDLGTTYSVVAAYDADKGDVQVIPNRQNERTTPSVVFVSNEGKVSVGRIAKDKLALSPERVIFEVKRKMGEVVGSRKVMAVAGDRELDPELASAFILRELKACAEKMIGQPVHDAVITVPAYFKEPQKEATMRAARLAKLNPRAIINEPTAAAIAYGLDSGEKQTFIVYDFGGGTFDVSIVRVIDANNVEVLGTGGDAHLGGGDIDAQIVNWALDRMRKKFGKDFSGNAKLVGRLRLEAEKVKIALCNENAPQDFAIANPTPEIEEFCERLMPDEFEAMARTILEKTLTQVDVALASAKKNNRLELEEVDAILLVGGSSKIPTVSRLLKEQYRKPIRSDLNPDEIVAMGAARVARNFDPSLAAELREDVPLEIDMTARPKDGVENTGYKDVVSHTLGVGLADDVLNPLIPKDHAIPHRVVKDGYTTARDNQTSVYLPIYQGDNPKASENHLCGTLELNGFTPEPKGYHKFEITFSLDANGIFEGWFVVCRTGARHEIKLDRGPLKISDKVLPSLVNMVESGALAPKEEPLLKTVKDMLPKLSADQRREIDALVATFVTTKDRGDKDAHAAAIAALTLALARHA